MMFIRRGQTMCYANGMLSSIFLSYALLLCFSHPFCSARDTITKDDPIKDDGSAGLVSAGGKFELGFFSLIAIGRYVGIWYHQPTPMTLVWVANRDNPLLANQTGVLAINRGTLQLRAAVAYLLSDFSDSYLKKGSGRIFQHNDSSYKQIAVLPRSEYNSTRLVMDYTGKLNWLVHKHNYWSPTWLEPIDNCSVYNPCGYFGSSCNSTNSPICKCLHGFKPQLPNKWDLGDFSGGCIRESNLCATTATNDTFFSLKVKKVQKPDSETSAANETECRNKCFNDCKCVAYSYVDSEIRNRATTRSCFTWASELSNLEEDSGGQDLYARIAMPDLEENPQEPTISSLENH